jgi:hypothetical protein
MKIFKCVSDIKEIENEKMDNKVLGLCLSASKKGESTLGAWLV